MIIGIIASVSIWFILMLLSFYLSDEDEVFFVLGLILGVFMIIFTIIEILTIYNLSKYPKHEEIDVYHNKIELVITSVSGVPQDTVVIWKGGKQ